MGQYYMTVNIDKGQYLNPHRFGQGLKLLEFGTSQGGLNTALALLLASGNGRGGGDLHSEDDIIGSWAGDRIVVAGDYGDDGEFLTEEQIAAWQESEGSDEIPNLYAFAEAGMEDISGKISIAMSADEWVREDVLRSLLDGFAHGTPANNEILSAIIKKYDCQEQADKLKEEIAELWRKRRAEWAAERETNNG